MVDAYAANGVNGILFKDEDGTRGSLLSKGSEIGRHLCSINACNSLYIHIVHAELTLDGWGTVVSTLIECAKGRDRRCEVVLIHVDEWSTNNVVTRKVTF